LYCERVAVAVGRLSVRIFGEETPGGERVAARSARGRALDALYETKSGLIDWPS
jgi:phytoene/squalene synthetase